MTSLAADTRPCVLILLFLTFDENSRIKFSELSKKKIIEALKFSSYMASLYSAGMQQQYWTDIKFIHLRTTLKCMLLLHYLYYTNTTLKHTSAPLCNSFLFTYPLAIIMITTRQHALNPNFMCLTESFKCMHITVSMRLISMCT